MSSVVHFLIWQGRRDRPACSPPWVDAEGRVTTEGTRVLENVTCKACKKTRKFRTIVRRNTREQS